MTATNQLIALSDAENFALTLKKNFGEEEWDVRLISNEIGGNLRKLYKATNAVLEVAAEEVLMQYAVSEGSIKDAES